MPITKTTKASQDFIPISEIRDGVVILKDGSLKMVLMASSINFALKSEDEQKGIILQYQNFLNSIDFSVQIFLQSRKLDIDPYINSLETRMKEQANNLIKTQTREYIDFIRNFTENVNVMTKSFFLVVPLDVSVVQSAKQRGFLSGIFGQKPTSQENLNNFMEQKTQLEQRVAVVQDGLNRIGVRTAVLGTEELVELYFKLYNPGESDVPTVAGNNNIQQ